MAVQGCRPMAKVSIWLKFKVAMVGSPLVFPSIINVGAAVAKRRIQ